MAILLNIYQLRKSFGARPLFSDLSFGIESGDRIGLIGPNGAGKSTLLRILASEESPDGGTLSFQKGLRVGFLKQIPELDPEATVLSTVMEGLSQHSSGEHWEEVAWAEECLSRLSLSEASTFSSSLKVGTLSGGWKKRVALARELARKPDLLLLDEPTNHLDLESILWLEEFLAQSSFATLTITHDRAFLQKVSNRIIELDRRNPNGLIDVHGSYSDYVEIKTQLLDSQKQREVTLKNTLRRETEWLDRGAKARTTKQQARIQRAENLKDEVSEIQSRNMNQTARIEFQKSSKSPKKLIVAETISKSYGDRKLFDHFSTIITNKSRIGILGTNGSGKSTLIRILLGEESPDHGTVVLSEHLQVAYFEQNRETLDPNLTLVKTLCPTGDHVIFQGRSIHIRSYLDRFIFDSTQMDMPIGRLSGGEQSRVLLAKLMLQEANILVLDEPTNDLDLATLGVLETCLEEFHGAVILVTHDRYFLDQVANQIIAFPSRGGGAKLLTFANLAQWEEWRLENQPQSQLKPKKARGEHYEPPEKKRKLSFKEQRELDTMEATITEAEADLAKWTEESSKTDNHSNPKRMMEIAHSLAEAQKRVNSLYQRWEELLK